MSDEVAQLAQVILNAAATGGVRFVNGVTVAAVEAGGTVLVDIGGQTVTVFVPASVPSPIPVGTQVRMSVEGAIRTIDALLDAAAPAVPVGGIIMWPSATAPAGGLWGICDGSAFSAGTFPALAALLGGTNLPDMRDRMPRGVSSGGAAVKSTGGSATITEANMPEHDHTIRNQTAGYTNAARGSDIAYELIGASTSGGWYTGLAGSGTAYWPKFYAVNYIIRMA